jgi:Tol biopolymer transport system component
VLDLAAQTTTVVTHRVYDRPRWSPVGDTIAYVPWNGGPIHVVAADGTGDRIASSGSRSYGDKGFDWSPDGRWIVARGPQSLEVIDTKTGMALPLGFATALTEPSWKP